jgi:cytochrome b561
MTMIDAPVSYTATHKLLHWLIAFLVIAAVIMGIAMVNVGRGTVQNVLFDLHRSVGALVLALAGIRLVWRLLHPVPPPVPGLAPLQALAARAVHVALYVLLFAMPLLGWAGTSAFGAKIMVFGLFELPPILARDRALSATLLGIHGWTGFAFAGLFTLHAAAALHHHFIRGDATLRRMLPGRWSGG